MSGADPELLLGGGANPQRGAPTQYFNTFSEKPCEIKEILVRKGGAPLNPPLHIVLPLKCFHSCSQRN